MLPLIIVYLVSGSEGAFVPCTPTEAVGIVPEAVRRCGGQAISPLLLPMSLMSLMSGTSCRLFEKCDLSKMDSIVVKSKCLQSVSAQMASGAIPQMKQVLKLLYERNVTEEQLESSFRIFNECAAKEGIVVPQDKKKSIKGFLRKVMKD